MTLSIGTSSAADFIYGYNETDDKTANRQLNITNSEVAEYDNIKINVTPPIENGRYTVSVSNKGQLKVSGDTEIISNSDKFGPLNWGIGTYALHVDNATADIDGNLNIQVKHNIPLENQPDTIGANGLYAENNASVEVGNENSKTVIWASAKKPDAISAKNGAKIKFHSTQNQIVGSIDFIDQSLGTHDSNVSIRFDGENSFWFGDDQSFQNIDELSIDAQAHAYVVMGSHDLNATAEMHIVKTGTDGLSELLNENIVQYISDVEHDSSNPLADLLIQIALATADIKPSDVLDVGNSVTDSMDLEFTNGAQWTYFGLDQKYEQTLEGLSQSVDLEGIHADITVDSASVSLNSVSKRISSITLNNAGIINLYEEDIQNTWKEIGLLDVWPELSNVKHDYVRIGDLKGSNGIFRLDLNSDNRTESDMVFIESSSTGGTHFIEPYRPQDLASVSDTNHLTFALTEQNANNITFADKQNIYGETLFDYELGLDKETITEENKAALQKLVTENYPDYENFNIDEYLGGTNWFINRLTISQSSASVGMRSAGYASYDAAIRMDRRDRRLYESVFQNEENDGIWVRVQYGEAGAEHLYEADMTSVYVGYEKATSPDNRLGLSFAYTDGNTDFSDVNGSGDIKRYEASIYDTLTIGSHYFDFVGRFGQVENDFDVTNQIGTLKTTGSFDQKYAALSVEYGYNLKDSNNVFIEPQIQVQAAYLDGYTYKTERNMKVDADSDVSIIGRAGIRAGKTFESSDLMGELYARADVLHQFTEGQDAKFMDSEQSMKVNWGDTDTWSTFGVGGFMNVKDNLLLQVDVERTVGGKTSDTWLVSGRLNYLF